MHKVIAFGIIFLLLLLIILGVIIELFAFRDE